VIRLDTLENQVKPVYLSIGSNLGNKKNNIDQAKYQLVQMGVKILQASNYYETLSWPNPANPKFFNIILEVSTNYSPIELLKKCKDIEKKLGRKKSARNSPRECDIDIIDFNGKKINKRLVLPHPRMHLRSFVLFPLFELNKKWKHPISKLHIKSLIFSLSNKDIRSIKQI
jgi:2-amino-4-hydroxy-6-hydroxymethyldihydropteridine diphosphokinase